MRTKSLTRPLSHFLTFIAVALVATLAGRVCAAENAVSQFETANTLYDQGKFAGAAETYSKLIESGSASSAIYFNLGNAFFKAGQTGRAIAAYRQAEQLSPRDADVRANLQFARRQIQGPTRSPRPWERWMSGLSINEWTLLASGAVWVWFVLLALGQIWPRLKTTLRSWVITVGFGALLLCACLAVVLYARSAAMAIVIVRDGSVRNGPLDASSTAFTAHDGAELQVLDRRTGWLQVSAGPRRIGWIKQGEILLASQHAK